MKANKQSKVVVPKSGFKRSRFNWSHDVNTTFAWGEMQPTQCKLLVPGSKTTFDAQSLIRLAPMVAPTFGRVKYKTYNQFVSLAEIMPNFDAMMAQEPVSTAYGTKVPQAVPSIKLGLLSSWCLQGARGTLYFADNATDAAAGIYRTYYRDSYVDSSSTNYGVWYSHASNVCGSGLPISATSDPWYNSSNKVLPDVTQSVILSLGGFGPNYTSVFGSVGNYQVALGSRIIPDLCPVKRSVDTVHADYQNEVTFESADIVLEGSVTNEGAGTTEYFALCLEFSDFGKRLRKFIQGCGYQVDLTSSARVSILPLFATYKAYFDIFGLELYQGWETTYCAKLIKYIENDFVTDLDSIFIRSTSASISSLSNSNYGIAFMLLEAANMWYTDDVDYVSAHMESLQVSPVLSRYGFISVDGNGEYRAQVNIDPNDGTYLSDGTAAAQNMQRDVNPNDSSKDYAINYATPADGLAYINQLQHTQVDAEVLKRMYRWVNRNTILGRRIAELLRAQGLGKYVDECKSNYIGSTDTMVTISDVVSTAATQDASLGEYGGKGLQYVNDKQLMFENDSYGYWITLACVVPESGYTQGLDPTLTSLDKLNLYNPDFDALGMEATPKQNVLATNYFVGRSTGHDMTFGFIPRYSKFKVCNNLTNGDFNRHCMRDVYLPYTLDKQLNLNDYFVLKSAYDESQMKSSVILRLSSRSNLMPIAGNTWRYPTKYNWLGNFDRIFLRVGDRDDSELAAVNESGVVGWSDYNPDNFLSHSIFNVQCYAPMKPIEDSYGLDEPDPSNVGVSFVSKA